MVKKKEEKELTVLPKQDTVPDYIMQNAGGRGKENITKEDVVLPRIKLLQPLSPEVLAEGSGVAPGHLYNTLTQQDYGASFVFIPITHFKSRIYWRDRDDLSGERMLCSARDGIHPSSTEYAPVCSDCPKQLWNNKAKTPEEKVPKCTVYYNFAILIEGETTPIALSMERTKIKSAKRLLSLITCCGNLDMFAKKYKIGVIKDPKGTWYNYDITPVGFVSAEEFKVAEAAYKAFKDIQITVNQTDTTASEE